MVDFSERVFDELRPQTISTLQQGPNDIPSFSESGYYFTPLFGIFRPGIGNSWRHLGGIFSSDPQLTWIAGKDAWGGLWTATVPASHNVNTVIPWIFRGGVLKGEVSLTRYFWAPLLAGRDSSNALWFHAFERDSIAQPWVPAQGVISRDP